VEQRSQLGIRADLSEKEDYVGALMLHFENSFQNNYWLKKKIRMNELSMSSANSEGSIFSSKTQVSTKVHMEFPCLTCSTDWKKIASHKQHFRLLAGANTRFAS
jgi:hypothetical protein